MIIKSQEEFDVLPPYGKGYMVYMLGARDDEPFVHLDYKPSPEDKAEFMRGQNEAVLYAQDSP